MRESYSSSPRASDPGYPIDHRADYGGDSERNSGNFVDGHAPERHRDEWTCPKCEWKSLDPPPTGEVPCPNCGEISVEWDRYCHRDRDDRRRLHSDIYEDDWSNHRRHDRDDRRRADSYADDWDRHRRYDRDEKRRRTEYEYESRRFQSRSRDGRDTHHHYDRQRRGEERRIQDREWPPSFDSSGASYIFDNRSGLFYESSSNFFYDPKTKLYYGNKQKKYYQFSPESTPPFQEVLTANGSNDTSTMNSSVDASMNPLPGNTVLPSFFPFLDHSQDLAADDLIVKALGGGSSSISSHANQDAKKKKIAISLRKSTEPSHSNTDEENKSVDASSQSIEVQSMNVKDPDPTAESIISSQLLKRHDADIAKWSQRGREMKNEHGAFAESVVVSKEIFRTPSGQPICLICKRKFASDEKLRQHEQLSDLHKQNLTKQSVVEPVMSGQDVQASVVMEYRDRASERRVLYPESHSLSVPSSTTLPSAHTSGVQEMIHPSQILNEEHIGNKMLQKMGWMGGSLGKANDDDSDPSDRKMSSKLREDWDRIESIASKRS